MAYIINGKAYNPVTAEVIVETEGVYGERRYHTTLYRTQRGAWFRVKEEWIDHDDVPEGRRDVRKHVDVMTMNEARAWAREVQATKTMSKPLGGI